MKCLEHEVFGCPGKRDDAGCGHLNSELNSAPGIGMKLWTETNDILVSVPNELKLRPWKTISPWVSWTGGSEPRA